MSQLILINKTTQQEIGRRPMTPNERYAWYAAFAEREPILFAGHLYRLEDVAWRKPEMDFVATVTYHSVAYVDD